MILDFMDLPKQLRLQAFVTAGFVTSALELWEGKNCSGAPGGIAGNLRWVFEHDEN